MSAEFKSHVLMRDEKGFFGIAFKRLILAAVAGGLAYSVSRFGAPGAAIPLGIGVALLVLVMSGTRGGLPLWQRLLLRGRGSLLLAARCCWRRVVIREVCPLRSPCHWSCRSI